MTRKDYILLAEALKAARMKSEFPAADEFNGGVDAAARLVADALARDNPRFDYDRFMKAAGVQR